MSLFMLSNLLFGQMPDAFGLMVFGFLMVGSSVILRRLLAKEPVTETEKGVVNREFGE
jgi:hypothetical protein